MLTLIRKTSFLYESAKSRKWPMDTTAEEARIEALRQTIATLEQRKIELLGDLTTLEEAIAAMQRRTRTVLHVEPQKKAQP